MEEIEYDFYTLHNILKKIIGYINIQINTDIYHHKNKSVIKPFHPYNNFWYKLILDEKEFNKSNYIDESKYNIMNILICDKEDIIHLTFDNNKNYTVSCYFQYNIHSRYFKFRIEPFTMTNKKLLIILLDIEERILNRKFYCELYRDLCVIKIHKEYLWFSKYG